MKRKIYIAGPMSGIKNENRPAFFAAAMQLESAGGIVLNPATLPAGLTQAQYMDICFAMIRAADGLLMLPGWEVSEGAVAEYHYARKLGLIIEMLGDQIESPMDKRRRGLQPIELNCQWAR